MTHQEAGRLGGQALVAKYGREHMARIGSKGFWAALESIVDRQREAGTYREKAGNGCRYLLKNLMARKGAR